MAEFLEDSAGVFRNVDACRTSDLCPQTSGVPRIEPVKLTNLSKSQLVQRLIVAIEQRQIGWPALSKAEGRVEGPAPWSTLTDELKRYEYAITHTMKSHLQASITGACPKSRKSNFLSTDQRRNATRQQRPPRHRNLFGIGSAWNVQSNIELYGNISQSYRPKLYTEAVPTGGTTLVPDDLDPSGIVQYDLGVRGRIGQAVVWDASVFQMDIDDQIGTVGLDGGLSTVGNIGDARHRGGPRTRHHRFDRRHQFQQRQGGHRFDRTVW